MINANGEKYGTVELTAEENWTITIEDLPLYIDGELITYSVEEVSVEFYTTTITGDQDNGFVITNTMEDFGEGDVEVPTETAEILPPHTGIDNNDNNTLAITIIALISSVSLLTFRRKIFE